LQHIERIFGETPKEALYVNLDNIWFSTHRLFGLAGEFDLKEVLYPYYREDSEIYHARWLHTVNVVLETDLPAVENIEKKIKQLQGTRADYGAGQCLFGLIQYRIWRWQQNSAVALRIFILDRKIILHKNPE
jgi:hypothetical protein